MASVLLLASLALAVLAFSIPAQAAVETVTQTAGGATWSLVGETSPELGNTYTYTINRTSGSEPTNEYVGFYVSSSSTVAHSRLGSDPASCGSSLYFCASFSPERLPSIFNNNQSHHSIVSLINNNTTVTATLAVGARTPTGTTISFGAMNGSAAPRSGGMLLTVTIPPSSAPGAPRDLAASAGDGEAVVTWTAPASDGGAAITRYQYRYSAGTAVSSSASWTNVLDGSDAGARLGDERGVTRTGLSNGTGYAFEVRAVNRSGFGAKAGPVTATPAAGSCAAPNFGNRRNIWTGTVTVAAGFPGPDNTHYGYSATDSVGSLDDNDFSIESTSFEVEHVLVYTPAAPDLSGDLQLELVELPGIVGGALPLTRHAAGQAAALSLHVCNTAYAFSSADLYTPLSTIFYWEADLDWSSVNTLTVHLSLPPNHAATGKPTVSGPTMVGGTLTAVTTGIADTDGLPSSFTYQWIRVDSDGTSNSTDISGATAGSYTLADADNGKKVKVKVGFTDVLGGEEERTSDAYPSAATVSMAVVPGAPTGLTASAGNGQAVLAWTAPAATGGPPITGYLYRSATGTTVPTSTSWLPVPDSDDAGASTADERGVTVTGLTNGTGYAFEVRAVNSVGFGAKTGPVTATPSATSCAARNFGARRNIWTGNLTVGSIMVSSVLYGYGFSGSTGGLDDKTFTVGSNYEIDGVAVIATGVTNAGDIAVSLKDSNLTTADRAALRLHVCNAAYDFSAAVEPTSTHTYRWVDDLDWSSVTSRTLRLSLPANNAATGRPTISGTAEVGEMLTAATTELADTDGLPTTFTYQWVRVDGSDETDIAGATESTYTVATADRGGKIKVKVSFTDDLSGEETRTSDAYPSSSTVPGLPTVSITPVHAKASPIVAYPAFRVTISEAQTSAVTVNLSIDQDVAYLGSTTQTITIPANRTSATGKFFSNYSLDATSGDLTATVAAGTGYAPEAAPEDAATVEMVVKAGSLYVTTQWVEGSYSVTEGDDLVVSVTLRTVADVPRPREAYRIALLTIEDTATLNVDYTHLSRTVAAAPADWSADGSVFTATATGTVETIDDSVYEGDERLLVSLSQAAGTPQLQICTNAIANTVTDCRTAITLTDDETVEVTGVAVSSSPSSGDTYGAGETISFTATFSEKVTVTGTPQFAFSLGGVTKQAAYVSGSDSTALVFSYPVAAGDNDADGISWAADALALNGGTIKFMTTVPADAVDAALTHAAGDAQSGHKVDTAPALSSAMVNGTTLTLTFSEALDMASVPAASDFTVKVGGTAVSLASSGAVEVSGSTVTLTLASAVAASATVTVSYAVPGTNPLQDAGGTDAAAFSDQAVINGTGNAAPVFANDAETRSFTETVGDEMVTTAVDVGAAVTATDTNNDPLAYSLEGTGAAKFDIVEASGQIRTKVGQTYDREAKASYSVIVKASDGMDTDTVAVTINVDDATEAPEAPGAPTVAPTVGDTTSLDVGWSAPGNTGRPALSGYKLRYRTGSGAWTDHAHSGTGTTATIASLTEATAYEVQVRAVNADGDGAWSQAGTGSTGTAEPMEPGAPRNLEAAAGDTEVALSWAAPASDGHSAITHYRYRYAAGSTVPSAAAWRDVPDSGDAGASTADERRVTVTGLVNETAYAFEVRAVNGVGEGPVATATATPAENPDLPGEVIELRALLHDGAVTLEWGAPLRSGSASITRYEYRHGAGRSVPSGVSWRSVAAGRYPFVGISGLENGRRYAFEVRAVNGHEFMGTAAVLTATPRARVARTLPTAPRGLRAAGSLYERGVSELAQVELNWQAPANLGNAYLIRYEYRYAAGGGSLSSAEWLHGGDAAVVTEGRVERAMTLRNLAPGTAYRFEVRAVTLVGAGAAATVVATTPRSERLSLGVFTRGAAVEGENLTIGVRRSGIPDPDAAVLAVVEIYDSAFSRPTAKTVDIPVGAREATVEFRVPFDGERGAARDLAVTLGPGTWKPESGYTVGTTPARATVPVRNMDPLVSVRDATVREGPQARLSFDVSLDRAAAEPVTVDYATSDGTATAGADYTATSGMLSFAVGEVAKTVEVPVLDDAHDEDTETLTLTLSNARGAALDDAVATGRIVNTGPIPKAWIARFGRTVAEQVVDAVEGRLQASAQPGVEVTLAGQRIGGGAAVDPQARDEAPARARLQAMSDWLQGGTEEAEKVRSGSRSVMPRELLTGSSFALTAEVDGGSGGVVSLWGRGAVSRFDGREGALSLDGEVVSGLLGADWVRERWSAGLLMSHSRGEGGYSGASAGKVPATLTGLFPWGHYRASERVSVWGVAGYGAGSLTVTPAKPDGSGDGAAIRTDLDLGMAAAGLRGVVLDGGQDGVSLAAKTDALVVQTASGRGRGADGDTLKAARGTVTRLRLGVEGSRPARLGGGAVLTPSLEIGVRHDGGDAETGFGLDLGGGLALVDPKLGIRAEVRGRGLLTHESKGFGERGLSGSFAWEPKQGTGRGPKLALTQTLGGPAADGADALLGRETLAGLAANDNGEGNRDLKSRRLELQFGYGFSAFGDRFTWTPEAGVGLSDTGRDYSLGWRLVRGGSGGDRGWLELSLEATRRESANDNADPVHAIGFKLSARF